jgi:EAL domain-containing protein (putative c-di-GMP-specific phosphodiesterase class I)
VASWQQSGFWQPQWHIAVNISPLQFYQEGFVDSLREYVSDAGIEFKHLCIEITETVAIENIEFAASRLAEIRALGMMVALDDFGTGYSSMSYLKDLPIDILKIDRCFIKDLEEHEKDRSIMQAITGVAKVMDLIIIAEGVETPEQVKLASECGCQYFQGFYFNKPVPAIDLVDVYQQ